MATLTTANLYDGVASRINLTGRTESFTTELASSLQNWARDGLRWLTMIAPGWAMESILSTETVCNIAPAGNQKRIVEFTGGCMRIVRVNYGSDMIHWVPPDVYEKIRNEYQGGTSCFGAGERVWSSLGGYVHVFRLDEDTDFTVDYVPLSVWNTTLTIPNGWEGLIFDYVALQAKLRRSTAEDAMRHWALFTRQLKRFQGFENVSLGVGG